MPPQLSILAESRRCGRRSPSQIIPSPLCCPVLESPGSYPASVRVEAHRLLRRLRVAVRYRASLVWASALSFVATSQTAKSQWIWTSAASSRFSTIQPRCTIDALNANAAPTFRMQYASFATEIDQPCAKKGKSRGI